MKIRLFFFLIFLIRYTDCSQCDQSRNFWWPGRRGFGWNSSNLDKNPTIDCSKRETLPFWSNELLDELKDSKVYTSEQEMIDLINTEGFQISVTDDEKCTMLDRAVQQNYTKAMQLLIDMGAKINSKSNRKQSPLHVAAENLSVEAAHLLLQCGAKINALDELEKTPLYQSLSINHELGKISDRIYQSLSINHELGKISDRKIAMVDLLLNHGADPTIVMFDSLYIGTVFHVNHGKDPKIINTDSFCPTVLFQVTFHDKPDIAKMLLAGGADISVKDCQNQTATQRASSPCIKELFEKWERIQRLKKQENRLVEMIALQIEEWKLTSLDDTFSDKFSAEFNEQVKAPGALARIEKLMNRK